MAVSTGTAPGGNISFNTTTNGVSVIPTNVTVSYPDLFARDACLDACGAVYFGEFFHAPFPPLIAAQKRNINQLELLTILVS